MTASEEVVAAMLRPSFYPHRPARVELVQTHISYVFLAGDQVFKVKKPVRFAFLDFSTRARRRHFCHEEVRLNRRLARDTYLGVARVRRGAGGTLELAEGYDSVSEQDEASGAGEVIEYAVHMRRLPSDRILARLLERGAAEPAHIEQVVEVLVPFHRAAPGGPEVARGGDPAEIRRLFDDDAREIEAFVGRTISAPMREAIVRFFRAFLARNDEALRRRQRDGRIREGHGDLHTEHVCFTERGVAIFDCIEFSSAFRCRDVAAEIAFLAMDLDFQGRPDLAELVVRRYAEKAEDPELPRLVPFYACQRALIRGKVDSLKSAEGEVEERERAAAQESARRHFALALRYTWSEVRLLVVVAGLSGSGKSTLARALCERTGFAHVDSDSTRKGLAGLAPTARPGEQLYTPEWSARTYAAMLEGGARALAAGRGAILDATFQRRADRDAARAAAAHADVPILIVECVCPEAEIRRRLDERARRDDDPSDAGWPIYQLQARTAEPIADDERGDALRVDTTRPRQALLEEIEERLRAVAAARS